MKKIFNVQKMMILLILLLLYGFFAITGNNFATVTTAVSIMDSCYYTGFIAIGMTFVIISSGIDLSVGTVAICGAVIGGYMYNQKGWPVGASLLLVVVICVIFGAINGFLIAYLKLPPFIATMGTQMMANGFGAIITHVQTQTWPQMTTEDGWYKHIFYKSSTGFPIGLFWLLGFFILGSIILNKTRLGRYTFGIGSNRDAVRLSGVNVRKYELLIYVLCGLFVGLGSVIYTSTYTTIIPTGGSGFEMSAIAATIIGGTSMSGGSGGLFGTLIGVLIMAVLKQGLMSIGLQGQWQNFFTGLIVIAAVLLDRYRLFDRIRDRKSVQA